MNRRRFIAAASTALLTTGAGCSSAVGSDSTATGQDDPVADARALGHVYAPPVGESQRPRRLRGVRDGPPEARRD